MHALIPIPRALLGVLAVLLSAPVAAQSTVQITKFAYVPQEITVEPGTTVVWTNRDETPHTVTGKNNELASPALDTGDRYERTFRAEGDYPYSCTLHPFMMGTVHVRKR